jgi:outer membrane lipoprotein SlyB
MKKIVLGLVTTTVILTGCESKTGTGALVGAGGGAVIGGAVGGWQGALIGGAAGAVGGALIGYALDEHDRAVMQERSPRTLQRIDRGEQLSIDDIKNMSKNGLKDEVIMNQIDATNSVFELSSDEIISLKKAGVSQRVINYMIETGER